MSTKDVANWCHDWFIALKKHVAKYGVDPPFGAILAAAHFTTWKSLAPPRVFSWEAGAESDVAFRMPMEVWQVA